MRSIGAGHVIDYTREDFADGRNHYDVILDIAENRSLSHRCRTLAPETLVIVRGEEGGRWLGGIDRQLRAHVLARFVGQKLGTWISTEREQDLETLHESARRRGYWLGDDLAPSRSRRRELAEVAEGNAISAAVDTASIGKARS